MTNNKYGEYSRTMRQIWYEPPIGGALSILKTLEADLSKTKKLIEKLSIDLERTTDINLKTHKKEFLEKIQIYNHILEKLLQDLRAYSSNILKILSKIDSKHPYYMEIVSCSNYLEPLLIAMSPIFFKARSLVEYELNEDLSNKQDFGNTKIYETHFMHDGSKFFSRALFRTKRFENPQTGAKGEARISFKIGDLYTPDEPIISARIDLEKEPNTNKYSVGFDFEFPNSRHIHRNEPDLSEKIVNGTMNSYSHHSFLTRITPEEFESFVDLCNYFISEN